MEMILLISSAEWEVTILQTLIWSHVEYWLPKKTFQTPKNSYKYLNLFTLEEVGGLDIQIQNTANISDYPFFLNLFITLLLTFNKFCVP